MKKNLELTYEEVGILLDLALLSNADTSDEPTARVLENLGEIYKEFSCGKSLAWLAEKAGCGAQAV